MDAQSLHHCCAGVNVVKVGLDLHPPLALPHVEIIQRILLAAGSLYGFIYYHTVIVNCLLFTSAGFSKLALSNVTGGRALSI